MRVAASHPTPDEYWLASDAYPLTAASHLLLVASVRLGQPSQRLLRSSTNQSSVPQLPLDFVGVQDATLQVDVLLFSNSILTGIAPYSVLRLSFESLHHIPPSCKYLDLVTQPFVHCLGESPLPPYIFSISTFLVDPSEADPKAKNTPSKPVAQTQSLVFVLSTCLAL